MSLLSIIRNCTNMVRTNLNFFSRKHPFSVEYVCKFKAIRQAKCITRLIETSVLRNLGKPENTRSSRCSILVSFVEFLNKYQYGSLL